MRGNGTSKIGTNDHLATDMSISLFTVFHIDPALSDEIFINEMAVDTEAEARSQIERNFAGHTILIVRKQIQGKKADAYPSARFINGEFRASSTA